MASWYREYISKWWMPTDKTRRVIGITRRVCTVQMRNGDGFGLAETQIEH